MLEELRGGGGGGGGGGGVSRMLVENSPASLAPVDKPRGGGRPGHRKKQPSTAAGTAHQLATGSADWVDPQHEPIMVS